VLQKQVPNSKMVISVAHSGAVHHMYVRYLMQYPVDLLYG
jgi:hypothetical protein